MAACDLRRSARPSKGRCAWAAGDPLLAAYHDREWGVPSRDDRYLFELLTLEGAQAGLAWLTILRKRAGYRRAFRGFDPEAVARLRARDLERIGRDPAVVRHPGKIASVAANARALLRVAAEHGSFAAYLWSFVGGRPLQSRRRSPGDLPAETPLSQTLSRDLRRHGFRFVGPTTCYAFMQAVGLVNDHSLSCYRYRELRQRR